MKSIYLIGGYLEHFGYFKGCYKYNLNYNKWTKIANLNIDRGNQPVQFSKVKLLQLEVIIGTAIEQILQNFMIIIKANGAVCRT